MSVNVLVVGSGGREHALAWKLAQSPRLGTLFVAPGNGGTSAVAINVPIPANDIARLADFAKKQGVGLTVVGPDEPLALGIVDAFRARGLRVFGPTRSAAEIESSKAFSKNLMQKAAVPTAAFRVFRSHGDALAFVHTHGAPVVVKASGLALGKGVYVCATLAQAEQALAELMLDRVHRDAGNEVIVESYLEGQEISVHAFCDGKTATLFPPSQDHKPAFDGDLGPNTGGMGSFAPVPWVSTEAMSDIGAQVVEPTLRALTDGGRTFSGILFPGLKMTTDGPKTLEFNARFGDPETQSYMRLLKTDLLDILEACVDGILHQMHIEWHGGFATCIVLASDGYPGKYVTGLPIHGITEAEAVPGVAVFHAGTVIDANTLKTAGGRVLGVSAIGSTLQEAVDRAYAAAALIHFEGMHYRKDIGAKSLLR